MRDIDFNGHVPAAPEPTLRDVYTLLGEMNTRLWSVEHLLATCDEALCPACAEEAKSA